MAAVPSENAVGVNVLFLRDHVVPALHNLCDGDAERLAAMTTADVCDMFVKKATETSKLSYTQHMLQQDPDAYAKYVGKATVFVSHARKYKFQTLVETIVAYEAAEAPGAYFWIDLFPLNQHDDTLLPDDWWQTTLKELIAQIGRVLVVLVPWAEAVAMKRAWCLWEMHCALQLKDSVVLHLKMPFSEQNKFMEELMIDYRRTTDKLLRLDAKQAEASSAHDKDMIFAAIEETIGFDTLNEEIKTFMRTWSFHTAETAVNAVFEGHALAAENVMRDRERLLDLGCLAGQVANLLRTNGRSDKALEYYEKEVVITCAVSGDNHSDTATAYSNIASVYGEQGQYDKALEYYEKELVVLRAVLGDNHLDIAAKYNIMAVVYKKQGKDDMALQFFEKALVTRQAVSGLNHPHNAATCISMAEIYDGQGQAQKALEYYEKAREIQQGKYQSEPQQTTTEGSASCCVVL